MATRPDSPGEHAHATCLCHEYESGVPARPSLRIARAHRVGDGAVAREPKKAKKAPAESESLIDTSAVMRKVSGCKVGCKERGMRGVPRRCVGASGPEPSRCARGQCSAVFSPADCIGGARYVSAGGGGGSERAAATLPADLTLCPVHAARAAFAGARPHNTTSIRQGRAEDHRRRSGARELPPGGFALRCHVQQASRGDCGARRQEFLLPLDRM